MARTPGSPIFYTLEFTDVSSGATNAQTKNLVFNDPGQIKGLTFEAIDSSGNRLERAAFFINIQRQNQFGLTTQETSAAAFTGTGERPFDLPASQMGTYRVSRNDSLTVTVKNLSGTAASYAHLCVFLHADRNGIG